MKRILVALDGSARAQKVLDAAQQLAQLVGAKLVLYRACSVLPDVPREANPAQLEELMIDHARKDLASFAAALPAGLVERTLTTLAIPWDGICRAARECDADLIAIGSHGYGGLDRILGTVAAKVVNHADRNVLVVRTLL